MFGEKKLIITER